MQHAGSRVHVEGRSPPPVVAACRPGSGWTSASTSAATRCLPASAVSSLPAPSSLGGGWALHLAWQATCRPCPAPLTLTPARRPRCRRLSPPGAACCVGCATWQRCFNLLPRMSLSLAMTSLFFVFVPWAFASFLSGGSSTSGQSIGGGGGALSAHAGAGNARCAGRQAHAATHAWRPVHAQRCRQVHCSTTSMPPHVPPTAPLTPPSALQPRPSM